VQAAAAAAAAAAANSTHKTRQWGHPTTARLAHCKLWSWLQLVHHTLEHHGCRTTQAERAAVLHQLDCCCYAAGRPCTAPALRLCCTRHCLADVFVHISSSPLQALALQLFASPPRVDVTPEMVVGASFSQYPLWFVVGCITCKHALNPEHAHEHLNVLPMLLLCIVLGTHEPV
jgi:hypothetical protein